MAEMQTVSSVSTRVEANPSFQHVGEAHACGKAIIIGEHAVVYGARAIAMPLVGRHMRVDIFSRKLVAGRTNELLVDGVVAPPHVCEVIAEGLELLGVEDLQLRLQGEHAIPIGAGLGSSASLCIMVVRAIAQAARLTLSADQIAAYATKLECRFHGNPSGLDTTVIAMEKPIIFGRDCGHEALTIAKSNSQYGPRGWSWVLIDSGLRASTKSMISVAQPFFTGDAGKQRVAIFDSLSMTTADGLRTGNSENVAGAMIEAYKLLKSAGVVTSDLEHIVNTSMQHGLAAAKPTGAGGGGVVLGLIDPNVAVSDQIAILKEKLPQFRIFSVTLG